MNLEAGEEELDLQDVIEFVTGTALAGALAGLPVIGLAALLTFVAPPRVHGQRPAIFEDIAGASFVGYDFNRDGQLDLVEYYPVGVTPRVPGYWIPVEPGSADFANLQEAYKKTQSSSEKPAENH